jgi:hypothetical protein
LAISTAEQDNGRTIRIGQVFRVSGAEIIRDENFVRYTELTRGQHNVGADIQKGMFFYRELREPGQAFNRLPAFIFHSNPFKKGSGDTPWADVIEPDFGYALFHGDNKQSNRKPLESWGNSKLCEIQHMYSDSRLRKFAPPILVFTQAQIQGNRKGYRQFSGYGIPVRFLISTQREHGTAHYFTNLVVELVLFRLDKENDLFDWHWIDLRRDSRADSDRILRHAPMAWKTWVSKGPSSLEFCRRQVARHRIVSEREQLNLSAPQSELLKQVVDYYSVRKHAFEGLASFVTQQVLGSRCSRGWVTKRSGDGGIDFVCKLEVGDQTSTLSRVQTVVLGQAKCVPISKATSGLHISRVVARLQRGWLGVFVTTSLFSRNAQMEVLEDKYPILLINGQKLAQVLESVCVRERISVEALLDRETAWYETNVQPLPPARVLDDFGYATHFDSVHGVE